MDKFKVDDQKIFYFPERIGQWLKAENDWEKLKKIYPIYVEVSPSSGCNHRCIFCALDYLEHKPSFLNYEKYQKFVKSAAKKGIRSIMFGGEGEPLLHPKIIDMVKITKEAGIDVAFTTNGSLMNANFLNKSLEYINWIKISLDAASEKTHQVIHRTPVGDYKNILNNIDHAVKLRNTKKYKCSIGIQLLLLPENAHEVLRLAKKAKEMGVNYFVVKPYSPGLYSKNKIQIDYRQYTSLEKNIRKLSNNNFSAVFRTQAFNRTSSHEEKYQHCLAAPFYWAYLMTNGDIYSCSAFLGNPKFILGNINEEPFTCIWEGEKRKANYKIIKNLPINKCRENCRMDKVNIYLEKIKNPPENCSFI